ncbi:MAG TPA: phosphocholine cytidylyltransferase family protein [Bryobacteraceae bacterium]|nr:phosphocholine cytidylyltransferase family protein [Bryobacteraceae bacterium]
MHAVILAAGRGSRLGVQTEDRPKCMVELAQRPLIARQMAALRRGGVTRIGVVRGYRGDMIDFPDVAYFENPRWAETNMVMSLVAAADWLRTGPAVISYADIFYGHDIVEQLAASPGDLAVAYDRGWRSLWTRRFADPLSDAETFRTDALGNLIEIGRRATRIEEIEGQYMGLLKFTPRAWSAVEAVLAGLDPKTRDAMDMTTLLRALLDSGFPISTAGISGQWGEIDSLDDLNLYEKMIREGELCLEN